MPFRSSAVRSVSSVDAALVLERLERLVELGGRDVEHDPAEHGHEAAPGVVAEALVAGQLDQAADGVLVEAQVEDRVHHPRHAEGRPRPHADQQRVLRVAEALARLLLQRGHVRQHVVPQARRQLLAGGVVGVAGLGGDGEAGRHRQAGIRHLGQSGALAAEQAAHLRVALGKGVDQLARLCLGGSLGSALAAGGGHAVTGPPCRLGRVDCTDVGACGPALEVLGAYPPATPRPAS